jgi:hypothetical protein
MPRVSPYKKALTIYVDQAVYEWLKDHAKRYGTKQSTIVNAILVTVKRRYGNPFVFLANHNGGDHGDA